MTLELLDNGQPLRGSGRASGIAWLGPLPLALSFIAVAFPAAVTLVSGVVRMLRPGEAMYGEGIVFGQALRLASGAQLYSRLGEPPYDVAAYTPVYYAIVAGLSRFFGTQLLPGRLLAFAALVCSAAVVAFVVQRKSGRIWGLAAGSLFLAEPAVEYWAGLHRVDTLALLLSLTALVAVERGRLRVGLALMLLAGLTKQTYLAGPLAAVLYLIFDGRRRTAFLFGLTYAALVVASTAMLQLVSGGQYLRHVVMANLNPFNVWLALDWLQATVWTAGPMLIAGLVGLYVLRERWRLWQLAFAFSLLQLVALGKEGSHFNYFLEPLALGCILAGGQLANAGKRAVAAAALILFAVLPTLAGLGQTFDAARETWQNRLVEQDSIEWVIARLKATPGNVISEDLAVLGMAGKPVAFEYVIFSILWADGLWDERPFLADVESGRYPVLLLVGNSDPLNGDCLCFPPNAWQLFRSVYRLQETHGRYAWYRYAGPADGNYRIPSEGA